MNTKVIEKQEEIDRIISKCEVCNLAMIDQQGMPYVIPMNFGYDQHTVYLHSSREGKKIGILGNNKNVCLSFSTDHELRFQSENVACSYGMRYRSVLIFGQVEFIEDYDAKIKALNIIMKNYTDREFKYNAPAVKDVFVFKVMVRKMEGRVHGY